MTNPWTAIWTRPREAVRAAIAQDRESEMYLLAALGGLLSSFDNLTRLGIGDRMSLPWVLLVWAFLGALGGWLSLLLMAGVLRWTGSWFGGEATSGEIRHACAWPCVPTLPSLAMTLVLVAVYGRSLFTTEGPDVTHAAAALGLATVTIGLGIVLGLWAMVVFVPALAEVQGFSLGRAIASVALPVGALVLLAISMGLMLG